MPKAYPTFGFCDIGEGAGDALAFLDASVCKAGWTVGTEAAIDGAMGDA
jgi:hypothetical protein